MKLIAKWEDMPIGRRVVVVDEAGNVLPNQRSVVLTSVPDDVVSVTVEFVVGGDFQLDIKD